MEVRASVGQVVQRLMQHGCMKVLVGQDPIMAKEKREHVMLVCSESGDINYYTRRAKTAPKLELRKYNPRLRKHTIHKEKKRK